MSSSTVSDRLRASSALHARMAEVAAAAIGRAADLIAERFRGGGRLFLCGNGGSAADCQHLAAEFVGRLSSGFERPGLPAVALTTDTSCLTAVANDYGFDQVFARQLQALGRAGDVLVGISTSGRSPNVVEAVREARRLEIAVVVLVGEGAPLVPLADVAIVVPSTDTQLVQQAHLAVEHILCGLVERALFPTA